MFRILALSLALFALPARADEVDFSADGGLVWSQKDMTITLSRNAAAKTADYTLLADEIVGRYRADKKIYRLVAAGAVRIDSRADSIRSDKLDYDLEKDFILLSPDAGREVYMKSKDSEVFSPRPVEYRRAEGYASALDARIVHAGRRLFADRMKIMFNSAGEMTRALGHGRIRIIDGEMELYGDEAEYNPSTGISIVSGNVYFKKGLAADLKGGRIVYDMNTGVANVLPKQGEKISGRFSTDKKDGGGKEPDAKN